MAKDPRLEGQRPLARDTVTIARLLRKVGYRTACIGKWGLGAPLSEGAPNRQGFDFFFGYNCQRQAHTYYPTHLWKNDKKVMLNNKLVIPHQKRQIDKPHLPSSYADFNQQDYAPALMEAETLNFIEKNKRDPFFLYFASPLPHLALQAPRAYVDRYRRIIGDEKPYLGKSYFPCQYPRATYAAMITYLDDQVGKIIGKLKEAGVYENTLVIFTSDNGPTYTGGADTVFFNSGGIFEEKYGWGKGFLHEGGIRVPLIASWPGKIAAGTKSDHISAFWDIMPTLGQAAGAAMPGNIDGISFLPQLTGQGRQMIHPYLYWEFPGYQGQQAVRLGRWKGIRKNIARGNLKIQLFDLEKNPRETKDLAAKHPRVVDQIRQIMIREHLESPIQRFKMTALGDG
jgi:arylsulfatase